MEKRIRFVTNKQNYNTGSYRIWIHDLDNYNIKFKDNFINEFVVETKHNIKELNEFCLKSCA